MADVKLDMVELGAQASVSDRVRKSVRFETEIEPRVQSMLIHSYLKLAGQRFEPVRVEYPRDWWHALKQRWFPRWALARWPVEMARIEWTPEVVYPLIALPDEPRWELKFNG